MTTFSVQHKVEVQFVPGGSFVDISGRSRGTVITRPRCTVETVVEATTCTVVLDNTPATAAELSAWGAPAGAVGFSPFTPDSKIAAFAGNIERDRMVRITYTWNAGANTSVRFFGWSDKWAPDLSGDIAQATVTLTGSCVLSRYARRDLISEYGEQITNAAHEDYWPYDDAPDATYLRGLSLDRTDIPAAQVIPSVDGTGTLSLSKPDSTILMDGMISLARGDGAVTNSPVVLHQLRTNEDVHRVSMWVRLDGDFTGTSDDICSAYDNNGLLVWRLQAALVSGVIQWRILDENQFTRTQYTTIYPRDDSWHWLSVLLYDNAGDPGSGLAIRDKTIPDQVVASYFTPWPRDPSKNIKWLVIGGNMNPRAAGKQANTLNGSISGVWVTQGTGITSSRSSVSAAGVVIPATTRAAYLVGYGAQIDAPVGGGVGFSGSIDNTPVMITNASDNLLDAWREHMRTVQGRIFTRPDGRRTLVYPDVVNQTVPALTLDAEADLHMPVGGWQGERIERPTRQTVNAPVGSVTLVDAVTEAATGLRLTGSDLDSSAGSVAVARGLAYRQLVAGQARLSSFGFDVTLMPSDQRSTVFALLPYQRIRVQGLPSAYLGVTWMDVYASGWEESYGIVDQSLTFVFDTDPADDPPEGIFDDAGYGRFAVGDSGCTVTGGTCLGTTATGTVIITSTSPLSAAAGDYPCDLDWNGERITVTTPGGATSPQTFTVTARGVAPSVARVHSAGEALEVWFAMRFGA